MELSGQAYENTSVILPLILAKRSHCFILLIVKLSREFQSSSPNANICHLGGQVSPGLTHLWEGNIEEQDTHSDVPQVEKRGDMLT